jgi:hypothetical protein
MRQLWIAAAALVSSLPALGQFGSLTTDYTGSQLFFVTKLSQVGTSQPNHGKLFLLDSEGLRPAAVIERVQYPSLAPIWRGNTNNYDVNAAHLASDGSRLSFSAAYECGVFVGLCGSLNSASIYDNSGQRFPRAIDGSIRLSPNGKWGVRTAIRVSGSVVLSVVDFATNTLADVSGIRSPASFHWQAHAIANSGTAVYSAERLWLRTADGIVSQIDSGRDERPEGARIDAEGRIVVWAQGGVLTTLDLTRPGSRITLPREDLLNEVGSTDGGRIWSGSRVVFDLSDDGRRIAFLAGTEHPQLYVVNTDRTRRHRILSVPEAISAMALSGDGRIAWVVAAGRILRVDLDVDIATQWLDANVAFGPRAGI